MSYAELFALSNFSFQHGASHPHELVRRAAELGYAALAMVDECSLAGIVRAHEAAREAKLPLIVGSHFRLATGDTLVLLAPDQQAYAELCALITRTRRRATKGSYHLEEVELDYRLSACVALYLPDSQLQTERLEWFSALPFKHKCLACTHTLAQHDDVRLQQLMELAVQYQLLPVAVGDVRYHQRARRPLHDVLTAIRLKTTVAQLGCAGLANGERHLRPLATLRKLFPEALLANTLTVASWCRFSLDELRYEYPHELVPTGFTATSHLRALTQAGVAQRWPQGVPDNVNLQIERELALIAELRYEHYFLTVADIVRYARSRQILCQGRGSAANSAVCYALGVTEVDPARMSLLFERFISKERAEPPDIDIDFEHQRREEVIQYIYAKYGRERAALAATVICYRPRMAIRDVGKALEFPAEVIDTLARRFQWFDDQQHLGRELQRLGLDVNSWRVQHWLQLVKELIGFPRHLSQHVGGFVISHHPLHTLVPLENAAMPERTIIQWDKEDLETLGLLKVDCLALGMLSAMRRTLAMISEYRRQPFSLQDIPAEDPSTYNMLCRGDAIGVFQVESRAQMNMLPKLKPRTYYDLVIEVAIIRPGPIQGGMLQAYLQRRMGVQPVSYPSVALQQVLARTCGVPIFQEQVMQIAMVAAGFSAGEADQVRRSMAAWQRRGGLEQFRDKLLSGMRANGYVATFAEQIYQQILGFGSYGFPESHAASFALLAYASAWLRCHEPAAFCAGLLNSQPMGFYAPAQLLNDARRQGVLVLPVEVSASDWDCTLERVAGQSQPALRLGLRMIQGLSEAQARQLMLARQQDVFRDVTDLAHRAGLLPRTMNLLARAGALSILSGARPQARWQALGVEFLPGMLAGTSATETPVSLPVMSESQHMLEDYRSLGFTLGRHPLAFLRTRFNQLQVCTAEQLHGLHSGQRVRVAGLVTHRQRPETAQGIIFVTLEDETGSSNLIVHLAVQQAQREALLESTLLAAQGVISNQQGVVQVVVDRLRDCSGWLGGLAIPSRDFH